MNTNKMTTGPATPYQLKNVFTAGIRRLVVDDLIFDLLSMLVQAFQMVVQQGSQCVAGDGANQNAGF